MLELLIIGGGIHGTYLAHALIHSKGVPARAVRILDPHPRLLHCWHHNTSNTGMTYLRSPAVHHIGLDPTHLRRYAATPQGRDFARFALPYRRPALALFNAHADAVIKTYGLQDLHLQTRATKLTRVTNGIRVDTPEGSLSARRVLLALGQGDQLAWPAWARALKHTCRINHIFDPDFRRAALAPWRHAVVIGGGLSAAQTARALAQKQPGSVSLISRHVPRVHDFDADPGWMGPKYLSAFYREPDYAKRRMLIRHARHTGSMTPHEAVELRLSRKRGKLVHCVADVTRAVLGNAVHLHLDSGDCIDADLILLATGFEARRPGGAWLDDFVLAHDLPCAPCGFPVVDSRLCWHRGLFVTGALAELELGPPARNILGARHAAERLVANF